MDIEELLKYYKTVENETFNFKELSHLSGNYAISCMKGYDKSFLEFYKGLSPKWREIANRKTKAEIRKEKLKKLFKNNLEN